MTKTKIKTRKTYLPRDTLKCWSQQLIRPKYRISVGVLAQEKLGKKQYFHTKAHKLQLTSKPNTS